MVTHSARPAFLHQLQQALASLYDPVQLRKSPLVRILGVEQQGDPATALRQLLVAAIEALEPDERVPAHTSLYSSYHLLNQRYVEQFTQKEVADDFGLSIRQLRRREKKALALLAERLAGQQRLDELDNLLVGPAQRGKLDAGISTPSRREEMAWSQKTFPSDSTDVATLLASMLEVADPLLRSLRVEVEVHLADALPRLVVEPVTVRQALLGVLTLAARFAPHRTLVIRTAAKPGAVEIQIAVDARLASLPLHDADAAEGVRIAGELVALFGGQLEVETGEARGRPLVRVTLPSEQQLTVLAVDDNPDTLHLFSRYSANTRYTVIGVRQPGQVLELAAKVAPQIIVLDVMLPEIDGWRLLGQLRAHPALERAPIIVCTILPQEGLARALGASGFLRKPVGRDEFLAALDAQASALR
jgi:CheY-like chemotaxis protein